MRPLRTLILTTTLVLLGACASTREVAPPAAPVAEAPRAAENYELDNLASVTWSRTSAESAALYLQAYGMARRALDMALADPTWTAAIEQTGDYGKLPPAVIVDIDETVLDTSDYMVERLRNGRPFSKADWNVWVQKANATPLPGALDFLKYAASKGVTVYYVSNREGVPSEPGLLDELGPTHRNLKQYGFPNTADTRNLLFRDASRGWKEKGARRIEIAKTHRIVMLVGDNLYDFADPVEGATRQQRDALVDEKASWLGTRWIVLPNPMYGSWESTVIGKQTGADARRAKLESVGVPAASADVIANGGFEN